MKYILLLFIILVMATDATAATYPTDGDNWTELSAADWSMSTNYGSALDSADKQVGTNSIRITTTEAGASAIRYDCANVDLSAYDNLVFWIKVNKTLAWRTTYSVYLDAAGANRWDISGNMPTTWTKITLAKSDMNAGDFSAVSRLHFDWDGDGHPMIFHIDGVHFDQDAAGTPDPTNLQNTKGTTWVNHAWDAGAGGNVTDSYNVSVNTVWHNTTTNAYYNNTGLSSGAWSNITIYAYNSTNSELSSGSVSENVQTVSVPVITSYGPTGSIYPEVQDSQLFNITVDQSTTCYWYVNGSLVETDSASTTHSYTNTSLVGGGCNVTADVGNANGNDMQTWIFEVGADSVSYTILQDSPTTQSMIKEIDVTRIGSNATDWGIWQNHTFSGWTYYFRYSIGTEIMHLTASSNNESLWFNDTSLLPTGTYFINATVSTNDIDIPANAYGFLCEDPSIAHPFNVIAGEFAHEICFSWLNNSGECWEFYWSGDAYNADLSIPKHDAYFVLMDGTGETVSCGVRAAGNVAIPTGWYATYLGESTAKTLTQIKSDMQVDGTVTNLYTWDHNAGGTGAWVSVDVTPSHSVLPNQGILINNMGAPYNWDGVVP